MLRRKLLNGITFVPVIRWLIAHHTTPAGTPWRTCCDVCAAPIWPRACGPRARCVGCRRRIGAPPWTVEVAAVAVAAAMLFSHLSGWELAAVSWFAALAVVLSFVDAMAHRLPIRLTATMTAGTSALFAVDAAVSHTWTRLLWAMVGGMGLAAALAVLSLLSPRGLGLGDAALGLPVGVLLVWWGWSALLVGLAWLAVLSLVTSVALLAARRVSWSSALPYGPFLCAGPLIAVLLVSA
jgi:leader peptidase (prepilin peptidase)/N-methyltransferase